MIDDLGDRMKMYEEAEAMRKLMPLLPICVRLDGHCFHTFTKTMQRPFDATLSDMMIETTKHLVDATNACIGYTQSDEISLILYSDSTKKEILFGGRIQKLVSLLASKYSVKFLSLVMQHFPEKVQELPEFDCRVWNVPTKKEAVNTLIWRECDASKNSVSALAQAHFSHNQLQGKNGKEMQEILFSQRQINWCDIDPRYKRGTYLQRRKVWRKFTTEEIDKLPPRHEARKNPNLMVERSEIRTLCMPILSTVINRVEVVFDGADPKVASSA